MLRHVDLAVDGGTTVALVGATGAGKSTLISLLGRNYDVTGGQVLVDGADVREVELNSLRSQIGVVTDDPFLFSATVHDNIAYGRPDATREEVVRAAERAQAAGFIESCPTATTPSSASAASRCRAASASGSRSRGRSSSTRGS